MFSDYNMSSDIGTIGRQAYGWNQINIDSTARLVQRNSSVIAI